MCFWTWLLSYFLTIHIVYTQHSLLFSSLFLWRFFKRSSLLLLCETITKVTWIRNMGLFQILKDNQSSFYMRLAGSVLPLSLWPLGLGCGTLSLSHAVACRTHDVLKWQCLDVSYLLAQELLKAPVCLGERTWAVVAPVPCAQPPRSPVAVCQLIARAGAELRSLGAGAALPCTSLPWLGMRRTLLHSPRGEGCNGLLGLLCHITQPCSQGIRDAVLLIHLEITNKNYYE